MLCRWSLPNSWCRHGLLDVVNLDAQKTSADSALARICGRYVAAVLLPRSILSLCLRALLGVESGPHLSRVAS